MLSFLQIQNFVTIENVNLDFELGFTVLTGETGAGKSILLNALGLTLGERAEPRFINDSNQNAEITSAFSVSENSEAQEWLTQRGYATDEGLCLLRRVLSATQPSRAFINGRPCLAQELKEIGELLIDICGQHNHQALLRPNAQRKMLDTFCKAQELADQTSSLAHEWAALNKQIESLERSNEGDQARRELLAYQVEELDELALEEGELEKLESKHRLLSGTSQMRDSIRQALVWCGKGEQGVLDLLGNSLRILKSEGQNDEHLQRICTELEARSIEMEEVVAQLTRYEENLDSDPKQLHETEKRLDQIYRLANKHRIEPKTLIALHQKLKNELTAVEALTQQISSLTKQLQSVENLFRETAQELSARRRRGGSELEQAVNQLLAELGMENCSLNVSMEPVPHDKPNEGGNERVVLEVTTIPGAKPYPLAKIASGGELSRIALAVQIVTSALSSVPSIVFDEVDSGIGGAVAEKIGRLIKKLGTSGLQVMCVTHLAQVASQANLHYRVEKTKQGNRVFTNVYRLDPSKRIEEIARMHGGVEITPKTRAHAKEMLGISG